MTTYMEREERSNLAAGLSAAEDGLTTNSEFDAAHTAAANAVFETSSGAPALSTFRAVEESNRISQLILDGNPLQRDINSVEGTAWPTPYSMPDFDAYLGLDPSDGVNTAQGSSYTAALPNGLDGFLGMNVPAEAIASFCDKSTPMLEGLARTITDADCIYLARGRKAPPRGFGKSRKPLGDMYMGATDYRSSFEGGSLESFQVKKKGLEKVQAAAAHPLTDGNAQVAKALIDQSDRLADTMEKRAAITENSRHQYKVLLVRVINLDARASRLMDRIYLPNGDLRETADPQDVRRLRMLRKKAFELGREAIRFQKTNVLGTALTENALGQARLLQQMALATAVGNKELVQVLSNTFDKFAENSVKVREQREEQVRNWSKKPGSLEGLEGFSAAVRDAVSADYWEAELAGMQVVELAYLGELAKGLEGWKFGDRLKKAAQTVGSGIKSAASAVGSAIKKVIPSKIKDAIASAAKKALDVAKQVGEAAKRATTFAAKKVATAAKTAADKIKNSKFAKNVVKVATPIVKAVKSAAKVVVAPVTATVRASKKIAHGDFRGALRSIGKTVKDTGKNIAAIGTNLYGGLSCAIMDTRLANQVVQGVGQAAGTVFGGGTVGGSVGREVGRKAGEVSQGLCKGMDELGLTGKQGINLRAKNIKNALKLTGKDLRSKFSKEAMLASAMRIAAGMATGGVGSGAVSIAADFGTNVVKQKALEFGRKKLVEKATKLGTTVASKALGPKAGGFIGQAVGAAAGAANGKFDAGAFARDQAKNAARAGVRAAGGRVATSVLGRRAGGVIVGVAQAAARGEGAPQFSRQALARAGMPSQAQILALARRTGKVPSTKQILAMARQDNQRHAMMQMAQRMGRRA